MNVDNTQKISYEIQERFSEVTQNYAKECDIKALFKNECSYTGNSSKINEELIKEIKKSFEEHSLDELLEDLIETKHDLFIEEENSLYQITTSYNQNNKIIFSKIKNIL